MWPAWLVNPCRTGDSKSGRLAAAALAGSIAACAAASPAAADLNVMVTIKPLYALVAQVMAGAGTPGLLVKGTSSPHTYALKPSDAIRLNQADVFFRMSEAMEPFTIRMAKALPPQVEVITLQSTRGLQLYPRRTGATFGDTRHHEREGGDGHEHDGTRGVTDGHAWLDPVNAKVLVDGIARALAAREPARAALFNANAAALKIRLDELSSELTRELAPVARKPYVVFHDALQYFERRYGLHVVGAIAVAPEVAPSAQRLSALRRKITSLGAVCVFAEPQFDMRLVENLVEGTRARTGTIDPEGSRIDPSPDLYFALLRSLAQDLKSCLDPLA